MKMKRLAAVLAIAMAGAALSVTPAEAKPPAPIDNVLDKPVPTVMGAPLVGKKYDNKGKKILKGLPAVSGGISTQSVQPACASMPCYQYAGKGQDGMAADGASVTIPIVNTFRWASDDHVLTELAVRSADGQQAIEIGVTKDPVVNSGSGAQAGNPHLFVGAWVNNVFQGYNTGGYIPVVGCSPCAGSNLTSAIGTDKSIAVQYLADGAGGIVDGWWIAYNAIWIGVFPETLWASPTYTVSGLVQVFGEIASNATSAPCTDMGNGQLSSGTGAVASAFDLINETPTGTAWNNTSLTDATKWDVATPTTTSMEFGGPGFNSIGTGNGVAGSCAPTTPTTCAATRYCMWQEICPDGSSTGCNSGVAYTGSMPLNTCMPIPLAAQGRQFNAWSNTFATKVRVYHTDTCGGSTFTTNAGSAGVYPAGTWDGTRIRGVIRTSTP